MINKDKIFQYVQWLILIALFAYDGFTYLPATSNVGLLKAIYYIFIFIAFCFIASMQINNGKLLYHRIGSISYAVQIFIWLYFIRLYYDFMITGVSQEIVSNPFAAVFLYVNAAIIPFYGLLFFKWELMNMRKINTSLLLAFLTMGMISLYYIISGKALEYIGVDGRFMGNESMDTIAFGHLGTSIVILSIALFYQSNIHIWHKLLSIFAIVVGLFITISAGSRGGLVALFICFIAYLYTNGHKAKIIVGIPLIVVLFLILLPVLNEILTSYDNLALERLYNSIYAPNDMTSGVTSGRDSLYSLALQRFWESPLMGSSLFINGQYVHNSILESFMSLGLFGGCLFLYIIGCVLKKSIQLAERNKQYLFFTLLFIQYLIYSLFSRTLSILPLFWLSMFIILTLDKENDESIDHSTVL